MPSVIFQSSACRHCDGKPLERQERRVLRTPTEDICCNCGEVLQTYPVPMQIAPTDGIILIPDQVSQALEKLLKTRLFELDREGSPELMRHHWAAIEKPPAH